MFIEEVQRHTKEEFEEWLSEHECDINFLGSSPAMGREGANALWERSIETHNRQFNSRVSKSEKSKLAKFEKKSVIMVGSRPK